MDIRGHLFPLGQEQDQEMQDPEVQNEGEQELPVGAFLLLILL